MIVGGQRSPSHERRRDVAGILIIKDVSQSSKVRAVMTMTFGARVGEAGFEPTIFGLG